LPFRWVRYLPVQFSVRLKPRLGRAARSAGASLSPQFALGAAVHSDGLAVSALPTGDQDARSLPIRFEEAPVVRKPGQRASDQDKKIYRAPKKQHNLSTRAVALLGEQRQQLDDKGAGQCARLLGYGEPFLDLPDLWRSILAQESSGDGPGICQDLSAGCAGDPFARNRAQSRVNLGALN
ncbi:MAG: hypothetical protein L0312_24460, partial [Acidobacteria bacterium]|nr:hypothetical protein [Acidobacteriota bacterium]